MTRGSVKELTKPFNHPEKAFHSCKRLSNTKDLDYSSPTELDYFSEKEEASEEEVTTETMTENTTMEEYMNEARAKCSPKIARPTPKRNKGFVARGQLLKFLQDNAFCGLEKGNANKHMERTL